MSLNMLNHFSYRLSGKQEYSSHCGVKCIEKKFANVRKSGVTEVLFQRAVAARRLLLFPSVEKVSKKTAAVNFLAGTISTPTERNKLAMNRLLCRLFMSRAVFLSIVVVLIVLSAKI
jgi:hypothetical protein